jgi:hypothetical protein
LGPPRLIKVEVVSERTIPTAPGGLYPCKVGSCGALLIRLMVIDGGGA